MSVKSKYKLTSGSSFGSVMVDAYCYDIRISLDCVAGSCVLWWEDYNEKHKEIVPIYKVPERIQAIMDIIDAQPNKEFVAAMVASRLKEYRKMKQEDYKANYGKKGGEE